VGTTGPAGATGATGAGGGTLAATTADGNISGPNTFSTFDAPPYTPLTTGQIRLSMDASTSASADGLQINYGLRRGGVAFGTYNDVNQTGSNLASGTFLSSGHVTDLVPCTAGVPITLGGSVSGPGGGATVNNTTIHLVIEELQTH
jgi:hypothetical protein